MTPRKPPSTPEEAETLRTYNREAKRKSRASGVKDKPRDDTRGYADRAEYKRKYQAEYRRKKRAENKLKK